MTKQAGRWARGAAAKNIFGFSSSGEQESDAHGGDSGMAEAGADGNRFAVKTQFEGEAGEKLFRQQMRFKGDKRFALTSAFREDATGAAECGRCRR